MKPEERTPTLVKRTCNNTQCVEYSFMANTPGCLGESGTQWTNGWRDAAESIMPYIILLDNFMGPILKRAARKKSSRAQSSTHQLRPPPPLLPTLWSATVRAILCWFTGWEDGNCCWSVIQDGRKGTGREEGRGGPVFGTFGTHAYFTQWLARCTQVWKYGELQEHCKDCKLCHCPCSWLTQWASMLTIQTRGVLLDSRSSSDSGWNTIAHILTCQAGKAQVFSSF